jgi:dGTP triphosphohydrolase
MTKTIRPNTTCTLQLHKKDHKPRENSFETAILDAVDEGFTPFGHYGKQAIYIHLENTFKIKKQEIPYKIEEFADAIEQIFGTGAKLIEIKILEALYERNQNFVHFPKRGELAFTEYVDDLRSFLRPQTF